MIYSDIGFELKQYLDSDEKLLWSDIPKQGIILKSSDFFMIPFSLMWGGFAIFWEYTVISSGAPLIFMLWGIPFVFVGIFLIFGRFFYDSELRRTTIYGMTQNRIIIKSGIFKKSIKSLNIRTLTDITLDEKADGTGTIILGSETERNGMIRSKGNKSTPVLELIPDVRKVYLQIFDLQKAI